MGLGLAQGAGKGVSRYTLTLQPDGTAGIDTYVRSGSANTNYATNAVIGFARADGDATYDSRALLKFDLSSLVGASIVTAKLYVYDAAFMDGNYDATYEVHRILLANAGWTETGATWNYANSALSLRWAGDAAANGGADAGCSQIGTDYAAAVMGSLAFASYALGKERLFTLDTTEFTNMVNANYGMALVMSASSWQRWGVASSDHATAGYRPKLVVEYDG